MEKLFSAKQEIDTFYSSRIETLSAEIRRLKQRDRLFLVSELVSFLAALAAFVGYASLGLYTPFLLVSVVLLAVYIGIRRLDEANDRKTDRLIRLRLVYAKERQYMSGDFSCFDDGRRYSDPRHAFAYDMDIYGRDSLFNRIDRTVTTGGSDMLASWLGGILPDEASVVKRRNAINELAGMESRRSDFLADGLKTDDKGKSQSAKIDTEAVKKAFADVAGMEMARKSRQLWTLLVAWAAIIAFVALIVLSVYGVISAVIAINWGLLQTLVVIGLNAKSIRRINEAAGKLHSSLQTYITLIRHIAATDFESEELKTLQTGLTNGSTGAMVSFERLSEILKSLDRRGNFIGLILFNMFALSDYFLVRKFIRWQTRYMESVDEWIDCVSRFDALVSMAVYRYNEPKAVEAAVEDTDGVVYEAKALYHPFLGDKAVANDFSVANDNYYIITGANMAGKSTFLRSVGINYILAMNGLPVFATSLRVSVFNLFSSMRTTDDLTRGISYFNAELLRLRSLIDSCRQARHTLIILDEILRGTNSLDKLNGSRLFLQSISRLPVTGIIATHDLELSKMESDASGRFHNLCFEIELAESVTYTYKITRGVARNQNATFLLKRMLENM